MQIDPAHRPAFRYESLWNIGVLVLLLWAEKRFRLSGGRLFTLYVAAYTLGRVWIEALRVDDVNHFLGLRLNIWTSILVFAGAVTVLVWRWPSRDPSPPHGPPDGGAVQQAGPPND